MRTIAIVGNSAAGDGKGQGPEIDAHEYVLRFNDFSIDSCYRADFGRRVTHHAFHRGCISCANNTAQLFMLGNPNHYPPGWESIESINAGPVTVIPPEYVRQCGRNAGVENECATSGLVMTLWMIEEGMHPVLYSFDGFATGHYYPRWNDDNVRSATVTHDGKTELSYLKLLNYKGAITLK